MIGVERRRGEGPSIIGVWAATGLCLLALGLGGCAARQGVGAGEPAEDGSEQAPGDSAAEASRPFMGTVSVHQTGMPCAVASRIGRGALVRMGYTVTEIVRPQPGSPGRVAGIKNTGWMTGDPGGEYRVVVNITCNDQGAEFEGMTYEPFPARLGFRKDFPKAIEKVAARRVVRPRVGNRPLRGLLIRVEPLRGGDAGKEFGIDLTALGITPVRIRIENRTPRTYVFETSRLQLVTPQGQRRRALPPTDVESQVDAELQAVVREKLIGDGAISPGETLAGFLYFPASAYSSAKLTLIDRDSEEAEGFSVEF